MGHNKHQRSWDLTASKASISRMGISPDTWATLVTKHFARADMTQMDAAMHAFQHDLKALLSRGGRT